jgi:hypothetical protein
MPGEELLADPLIESAISRAAKIGALARFTFGARRMPLAWSSVYAHGEPAGRILHDLTSVLGIIFAFF